MHVVKSPENSSFCHKRCEVIQSVLSQLAQWIVHCNRINQGNPLICIMIPNNRKFEQMKRNNGVLSEECQIWHLVCVVKASDGERLDPKISLWT